MGTAMTAERSRETKRLMRELGLVHASAKSLAWTRRRKGDGFTFHKTDSNRITDPSIVKRLNALAVPPAYRAVRFAANPKAHLQAVGTDDAGRLQYRYHADWESVRESRKATRLGEMAAAMPRIRRAIARDLKAIEPDKTLALAACVELIARTAIRAGGERYEQERGSRGATTLLKSHVKIEGKKVCLFFRGKGGKDVERRATSPRLCGAIAKLVTLPGGRLFQYRNGQDSVHRLRAVDVNTYLQSIAGCVITLKDFRTLLASSMVVGQLAATEPASSEHGRKKQIKEAIALAAGELVNTPTVARKSYVHDSVVEAFESGKLKRLAKNRPVCTNDACRVELLAEIVGETV